MKTSKFSFIGLILSVLFSAGVFTLVFSVFDIMSQPYSGLKLLFIGINAFIVMILSMFCGLLCSKITLPMFSAISFVTLFYTILQFAGFIVSSLYFVSDQINLYVLFQIALHFIYFAIVLPIGTAGYHIAHKDI